MNPKIKDIYNLVILQNQLRNIQQVRKFYEDKFGYDFSLHSEDLKELYEETLSKEKQYQELILAFKTIEEDYVTSYLDIVNDEIDKINQLGFCFSKLERVEWAWMTSTQSCEQAWRDEDEEDYWDSSGCSEEWYSSDSSCEIY